ncbi:6816_t:CDS:2 [Entrophospora sp. SA101]|nr:6816_t:CDS:2 [Entrophospora sp. SA101]
MNRQTVFVDIGYKFAINNNASTYENDASQNFSFRDYLQKDNPLVTEELDNRAWKNRFIGFIGEAKQSIIDDKLITKQCPRLDVSTVSSTLIKKFDENYNTKLRTLQFSRYLSTNNQLTSLEIEDTAITNLDLSISSLKKSKNN